MATYHYRNAEGLTYKDVDINSVKGFKFYVENPDDIENSRVIWEVRHGMFEDVKITCPFTGKPAVKTGVGCTPAELWFKGNGMAKDKAGAQRDMNAYTLKNNDPYGYMRQPGEVDCMINDLKKGGKYNPKTQYFTT